MTPCRTNPNFIHLLVAGCLALCFSAQTQVILNLYVDKPSAGALVGDNLSIVVETGSTWEVQTVTAAVAGRMTNLTYTANVGWTGNLSLAGLSQGQQMLQINATDVFSNSSQAQQSFVYDRPPVLTLLEPTLPALGRTQLRVRAIATTDSPAGAFIGVYSPDFFGLGPLLASATNNLDTVIDVSKWDGLSLRLAFYATDPTGQTSITNVTVYVVGDTNVLEVDRVSGTIRDYSAESILFTEGTVLKTKSRTTGVETVLLDRPDIVVGGNTFLTPRGAIFGSFGIFGFPLELYEIRDQALVDLGAYPANLVVKGNYAIWIAGATLMLRDLWAGTNVVVSTDAVNNSNDVAANGDVVYWTGDFSIYRYRNGISTRLADGIYPVTDGINVAYFTGSPSFTNVALFDGTNESILGSILGSPNAGAAPRLIGGWTAFNRLGNGPSQVWTRSPSGVLAQKTFFGISSSLSGLDPNGEVIVTSPASQPAWLYFPPDFNVKFGPWNFGTFTWIQGNWYAALGSSLVTITVPSAPAISSATWLINGQFSFHVTASIGQQLITQESKDLMTWTSINTNLVTGTAGIQATAPALSGSENRFFRVVVVK